LPEKKWSRRRLKEIEFVESIPKTRSGKILRRLLKARELGLPEGDISTLRSPKIKNRGQTHQN
jgi:acyl-coenzyme A synthetase/AMP-(fatty) acid ligase